MLIFILTSILLDFIFILPLNLLFFDFALIGIALFQTILSRFTYSKDFILLVIVLIFLNILKFLFFKQTDFFSEIRILLIFFDAYVLSLLLTKDQYSKFIFCLSLIFFTLFFLHFKFNSYFIPTSSKQWIATFPSLILVYFFLKQKRNIFSLIISLGIILLAIYYSSRILLLLSISLFIFNFIKNKYLISIILLSIILLSLNIEKYLEVNEYSNIVRFSFFESLFVNFNILELLVGMGFDDYINETYKLFLSKEELIENRSYNLLYTDGGNPHFFVIELIIYFGLVGLSMIVYQYLKILNLKDTKLLVILFIMLISFNTSNTGFERIYLSLLISLTLIFFKKEVSKK